MADCQSLLNAKMVTPRQVASCTGRLIAMQWAIGPDSRIMTRRLSFWVEDKISRKQKLASSAPDTWGPVMERIEKNVTLGAAAAVKSGHRIQRTIGIGRRGT